MLGAYILQGTVFQYGLMHKEKVHCDVVATVTYS